MLASVQSGWRRRIADRSTRALTLALALVAVYAVLRTIDAPEAVLLGWTIAAAALTVLSLVGGLSILAAIGPFTEALTDEGLITAVPFLLAALGVGTVVALVRMAIEGRFPRPSVPVRLAVVLFTGTLLGVLVTALSFGPGRGLEALQLWVPGIGGGLVVLLAAWLLGREGEYRPLLIVAGSITLAALLSVADYLQGGGLRDGALGWLLRPDPLQARMTGIIPAANPAATIFLVGLATAVAAIVFGRNHWFRLLAQAQSYFSRLC